MMLFVACATMPAPRRPVRDAQPAEEQAEHEDRAALHGGLIERHAELEVRGAEEHRLHDDRRA